MRTMSILLVLCLASRDVPEPPTKHLEIKWREIKGPYDSYGFLHRGVDPETGYTIYLSSKAGISAVPPQR